jgi:hypothetical protein
MIRKTLSLVSASVLLAGVLVLGGGATALADTNNCPSGGIGNAATYPNASVAATLSGDLATYSYVLGTTDLSASGGISGLIKLCVYPDGGVLPDGVTVTAVGDDGSAWTDPPGAGNFDFGRPDGNPSNIGFDGNTHDIGSATWNGGAPAETLLLHVNDPAWCSSQYSGSPQTCFAFPSNGGCDSCGGGTGTALDVNKTAAGAYTTTYGWSVSKSVDKTRVEQVGGSATFNYTVTVSHDAGADGLEVVSGQITVGNPNDDPVHIDSVTDALSDKTVCDVTDGTDFDVAGQVSGVDGSVTLDYLCPGTTVDDSLTNTATAVWSDQTLSPSLDFLAGSGVTGVTKTVDVGAATQLFSDTCVDVTDTYKGSLGTVCTSDANPTELKYSRTISIPASGCLSYDNTATITTNDSKTATDSNTVTVTVCGPAHTGALTMGFWQNKNGQTIITTYSGTNCQTLAAWLKTYHPFSDLNATICGTSAGLTNKTSTNATGVAGYVYNVIKSATCTTSSKTCNSMLKAQMLATALDVYFGGGPGGNRIGAPSSVGAVSIDLTKVCAMIDGSGGSATCSGSYANVSAQFGGATCMTISNMLTYQNTSDPAVDAGAFWYGQVKASQVNAKNTFDAINNQVAYSC